MRNTKARHGAQHIVVFGHAVGPRGVLVRRPVDTSGRGDYGADPIGDGTFRMVPSGDIVDGDERDRRLRR